MTRLMIYGIISLLIQGLLINCSKNHYKDTYIKNGFVYNEKLNFKMKIYGDIKQIKIDTSKNIEIKKSRNKLIFYGTTYMEPFYDIIVCLQKCEIKNSIAMSKKIGNTEFNLHLINKLDTNDNFILNDAKDLLSSINNIDRAIVSPFEVLNKNIESINYLKVLNELNEIKENNFTKKQLLLTFNSFISNNEDYYKNLNEFEKPLKLKQFKVIDSLNKLNKIITGENEIQKELAKLIQNEKLIIINESHWKPNHRLFLNHLLPLLKSKGFNNIAFEGIYDSLFNAKINLKTGFYSKETQYQKLINEALKQDFNIIPYDFSSDNRELEPINKFKRILDNDKLIIFVGFDHVIENSKSNKKWLAENIKVLLNINPVTISQTTLFHDDIDIGLVYDNLLPEDFSSKNIVDFHIINNLRFEIKGEKISIENNFSNDKELIFHFYEDPLNLNDPYKIPTYSYVLKDVGGNFKLDLPKGKYFYEIYNKNNDFIVLKNIEVY